MAGVKLLEPPTGYPKRRVVPAAGLLLGPGSVSMETNVCEE